MPLVADLPPRTEAPLVAPLQGNLPAADAGAAAEAQNYGRGPVSAASKITGPVHDTVKTFEDLELRLRTAHPEVSLKDLGIREVGTDKVQNNMYLLVAHDSVSPIKFVRVERGLLAEIADSLDKEKQGAFKGMEAVRQIGADIRQRAVMSQYDVRFDAVQNQVLCRDASGKIISLDLTPLEMNKVAGQDLSDRFALMIKRMERLDGRFDAKDSLGIAHYGVNSSGDFMISRVSPNGEDLGTIKADSALLSKLGAIAGRSVGNAREFNVAGWCREMNRVLDSVPKSFRPEVSAAPVGAAFP